MLVRPTWKSVFVCATLPKVQQISHKSAINPVRGLLRTEGRGLGGKGACLNNLKGLFTKWTGETRLLVVSRGSQDATTTDLKIIV